LSGPFACFLLVFVFTASVALPRHVQIDGPWITTDVTRISVTAVFLTDRGGTRIPHLYEYIKASYPPSGFRYYFINWTDTNQTDPPVLVPPARYRELVDFGATSNMTWEDGIKSPNLWANFFFCLNYFLESTSARWFYRGTDDTILNFRLLPLYITDLERHYDPLRQFLVQGNCIIVPWSQFAYPQGGAGYLFSRFACEQIAPMARYVLSHGHGAEDNYMGEFLNELNFTGVMVTSDKFFGYTIHEEQREILMTRDYDKLPVCPRMPNGGPDGCRRFMSPTQNLVFFHQALPFDEYYRSLASHVFTTPPSIKWWMVYHEPELCRARQRVLDYF
jgi:hypothetical protein